jgi:hypothetical protein
MSQNQNDLSLNFEHNFTPAQQLLMAISPRLKREVLNQAANKLLIAAKEHADENTKFGFLVASIKMNRAGDGYRVFTDTNIAPYAPFVHWGYRARPPLPPIEARRRKALRWQGADGRFIFAKKVSRHPGFRGNPFMQRAMDDVISQADDLFALSYRIASNSR